MNCEPRTATYKTLFSVLLVATVSLAVYSNTLRNSFVYDDTAVIEDSRLIRSVTNLVNLFTPDYFRFSGEATYRPVVTFSYFLDYSLWKLKPFGYHLTNLFLHILNSVLVYLFIRQLLKRHLPALFSALIFSVHPVTSETVNAIGFREDLLCLIFGIAALLVYPKNSSAPQKKHFFLCPVFFLLALFSKEMAVTFPLIFLLSELSFSGDFVESTRNKFSLHLTLIVVLGIYLLVRFVLLTNPRQPDFSYAALPSRLTSIGLEVLFYFKLLFVPVKLSAEYIFPLTNSFREPKIILAATLLAVIVFSSILARRRFPEPVFAIWWFLLTLLPVLNIIPLFNPVAERYLYLPLVGFSLLLGLLIEGWYRQARTKYPSISILILLLCFYSARTFVRNRDWKDSFSLCRKTLETCPGSARFHNNLGIAYKEIHQLEQAIREYRTALKIDPGYERAHYNLGIVYEIQGRLEEAIVEYRAALAINPRDVRVHNNLGSLYHRKNLLEEATREFRTALNLDPDYERAHYNLGIVYEDLDHPEKAFPEYQAALRANPEFVPARNNLGVLYRKQGLFDEAINEFQTAVKINPEYVGARYNLALAYRDTGDPEKAVKELRVILERSPDNADVHARLAAVLFESGKYAQAKKHCEQALAFDSSLGEAKDFLEKLQRMGY